MRTLKNFLLIVIFLTASSVVNSQMVTDIDGNRYSVVKIKKQVWMGENLRTTRFNDNKPIHLVTKDKEWKELSSPAYCWLNNDTTNKELYGALYNWYAAKSGKLCPAGWHVPSKDEWMELCAATGDRETAGAKLKEVGYAHWTNNIIICTDEYGFTALPAGKRLMEGNFPSDVNNYAVWWTTTEFNSIAAWNTGLYYRTSFFYCGGDNKKNGFSVRCIKN